MTNYKGIFKKKKRWLIISSLSSWKIDNDYKTFNGALIDFILIANRLKIFLRYLIKGADCEAISIVAFNCF